MIRQTSDDPMSDEMLMAFADGELDQDTMAEIGRRVAADPALARRAEQFRATRQQARDAYADILSEPAPPALVAAALARPAGRRPRLRVDPPRWLPIAATLALVAGAGGYFLGLSSNPAAIDLFAAPAVAEALGATASGQSRTVRTAAGEVRLTTLAAYRVEDGLCRTFTLAGAGVGIRGVGCCIGKDDAWRVNIAVAHDGTTYAPAGQGALGSLDAYLEAIDAQGPLSAEEEAAAEP